MKKPTIMVCAFMASIGFMGAQNVQLPAAYFNTNAPAVVAETVSLNENEPLQRNPNVNIPFTGSYGVTADVVYDNGPYFNIAGTPDLSVLESNTLGMGTYGPSASFANGFSVADDVTLTGAYEISSIDVFAYQSFEMAPTITAVYLRVYNDDPSMGGSVIWGDFVTDVTGDVTYAEANRVLESDQASTDRQINRVNAETNGLVLGAGTYWIEYSFEGSGASGPWAPPIAILGQPTTGNAMQSNGTDWSLLEDGGTLTPQGLPFIMYGTPTVIGVEDNKLSGFSFYPNPTNGVLNLNAHNNIEAVSVFNLLGQKVMAVNVDATTANINLEGLAAGSYIMKVTVEGHTGTYKITKK